MLDGHGDDLHRYPGITMNFSSNIYAHADLVPLEEHLRSRISLIRSYPEPEPRHLEAAIADALGIGPDEVMATSGATDAIWLTAQAFREMRTYRVFTPTFSEYEDACRAFGYAESETAPLCWLCNPNNPTGEAFDADHVGALARRHELLVIDQSYEDYTLRPALSAQEALRMGNVIQLRSLTKRYAVPGLRIGYVTAPADIIRRLRSHYRPWAVNALAIEAGLWLLRQGRPAVPDLRAYLDEAARLAMRLDLIPGICVGSDFGRSATNFMLCRIEPCTAAVLKEHLASQKGILIRDAANFRGLTPHHFRIAAQTREEDDALVAAVAGFMEGRLWE